LLITSFWDRTGVAWLSSVRAVRCLVYSFNERNSCSILVPSWINL
jgi:hypothetical protein